MSEVKMPEPEAYLYVQGGDFPGKGVRIRKTTEMATATDVFEHGLITTDQAEEYANAKVQEALKEAACFIEGWAKAMADAGKEAEACFVTKSADGVRALKGGEE